MVEIIFGILPTELAKHLFTGGEKPVDEAAMVVAEFDQPAHEWAGHSDLVRDLHEGSSNLEPG